jgi:L-fuculose-phosphate aldolase
VNADYGRERSEVLEAVRRIVAAGLVSGASGNVSRRIITAGGDLFAVTASRVPYSRFTLDDVLVVDADVEPVVGDGVPSSESLVHMAIYAARADVGAVIHSHSIYASAFAVAGAPLPCILDEQVLTLGGTIAVAEYAPSASEDLAKNAVAALGDRAAVLLQHHGVVGVGADVEAAVEATELVERIAQIRAVNTQIGRPRELPAEVVAAQEKVYRMMKGFKER